MKRTDLIVHSLSRATLWLFAHAALEWLFHATKPSIVSAAPPSVQPLLLIATPASVLLWILPLAAALAALDSLRAQPRARWLAALVPALLATVLAVVAFDNFTKTVAGFGIIDTTSRTNGFYLTVVLMAGAALWRREALLLAGRWSGRGPGLAAALLALASVAASMPILIPVASKARTPNAAAAISQPNFLLIGMDGVAAEQLALYRAGGVPTPHLARLAARGILFENAFSNAGRTYGSLIGLLSGRLPTETGILMPPDYLTGAAASDHLPALLRTAGYSNAQVGMRHYADAADWNMKGGFHFVNGRAVSAETAARDLSAAQERVVRYRAELAERVVDRVLHLTWLRSMNDEYTFLTDKSGGNPYFEDERRLRLARDFILSRREPWLLHIHLLGTHGCTNCGEAIRRVDATIGNLVSLVEQSGQLARTVIIVYSDHSPSWGTLDRLPLLLVTPAAEGADRVRPNVQLADVAPTMLELSGIAQPKWMSGVSLLKAGQDPARPIFSLGPFGAPDTAGAITCDRWVSVDLKTGASRSGMAAGHTGGCRSQTAPLPAAIFEHLGGRSITTTQR